jgi:hypothetical protein
MLDHSAGSGRHTDADRGLDLYSTPPVAVESLLSVERLPHQVWEPACGRGGIARVLLAHGHAVVASDVTDHGDYELDFVADFLTTPKAPARYGAVATNPPYKYAAGFADHALGLVPDVFMLLRLAFLESTRRTELLERRGLRAVHVFRKRLPMMHRDGWTGPRASNAIPFAWFCWRRGYSGPTIIDRI